MRQIEAHLPVESTTDTPLDLLHSATGLAKQRIKLAMTQGAVWISRGSHTQRLRRAKRALRAGDELHLYYDEKILAEVPPPPRLVEDLGAYSVWDKPCGLRSQGSKWGDHCTLARWAERHLLPERSAFTVHRLDRAANGLMLVAHTKTTAAALSALFKNRAVEKCYRALLSGDFSGQPNPLRVEKKIDGKEALSEISLLHVIEGGERSLVDVRIETGRKHQIRRHLADLGYPIVGDRLYGTSKADGVDLQLSAHLLAFYCPVKNERVEYRLPIEGIMDGLVEKQ
jgi:tRNA pseudouridine32 synthase/23S rRNA pseudouridine746 synthase